MNVRCRDVTGIVFSGDVSHPRRRISVIVPTSGLFEVSRCESES